MKTSNELLDVVNEYIDNIIYDRKPQSLYEPIKYVLSLGGKRIRPVLMLMAYNMYKEDIMSALPCACGIETYHNFTLLHDDLMDNADMRRGKDTVHKKWDSNMAILSGDTMLVTAFSRMAECDPTHMPDVIKLFTKTALEIDEGQQYDIEFETRDNVMEEEYMEMIRLKTSVLLACAMKIGAILADAPLEDQECLYKFGEKLGLSFQLQDDYLDVYGDPKVFGKNIGGDITENKKTFMLINAMKLAEGNDKAELEKWCSLSAEQILDDECIRDEKIKAVTAIYNKLSIDKLARQRMEEYYLDALHYLDAVSVPAGRKTILFEFAAKMMKRDK
ncbi:MAG: polyprenyl synthetase family protein [Bacteroidales bacterium]|nr:polyprenyl synthetase family protein [Bacteroidales bacterium]MCM1147438.1 polyprenyl synthetase family protein [Bacteroidales bacterium]MCM1206107.1 polyprenyl synthetase family protein [Bacillota bacterium]